MVLIHGSFRRNTEQLTHSTLNIQRQATRHPAHNIARRRSRLHNVGHTSTHYSYDNYTFMQQIKQSSSSEKRQESAGFVLLDLPSLQVTNDLEQAGGVLEHITY